jgi:dolichyl-phosphate-mannose-protein mannosyltransferase
MGRVLYVHHYFPALYFAIISLSFTIDHYAKKCPKYIGWAIIAFFGIAATANFLFFADFTFGFDTPASGYANRHWVKTWNLIDEIE